MDFLQLLDIRNENSGTSTGSEWLTSKEVDALTVISPVNGKKIGKVHQTSVAAYEKVIHAAQIASNHWRLVPAPKRGEVIRQIGIKLREHKEPLGHLISYEMGKSLQEGLGEVQEAIDICDFAVGQSRMLYGFTMPSERGNHRLYEQYHPLGLVGIATAFNFPVAVWAWNAAIASVCGNVCIWKPSSSVPLSAIATHKIIAGVLNQARLPEGIFSLVIGQGSTVGEAMLSDRRLPLISFTGSVKVGRHAAEVIGKRLGKTILELSGNNAIIMTKSADLKLALSAVVFGAVGTAGQRCTTTRRLIVHESIYDNVLSALVTAYKSLRIGNPVDENNHMGPLISKAAVSKFREALAVVKTQGGTVVYGGEVLSGKSFESGCYVTPALVAADRQLPIIKTETFGPILYLLKYKGTLASAIALQNDVQQGLSSAIFTNDLREAEEFLSCAGSDCGIANVNIGTSGAEIGGAFGGEKDSGGGRESGSDAWKAYMRRQTVTINYGAELPLAQGIQFNI